MAKRWYVVNVYAGFEKKIASQITEQAQKKGLSHCFEEILIPSEQVTEVKRGQKVSVERKFFPGYMLFNMELTNETWHLVKDTPKVTGFLGTQNRPAPLSAAEAKRIVHQAKEGIENPRSNLSFEVGEQVRISGAGAFSGFNGTVVEVDPTRQRLKLTVAVFGRETLTDADFTQVEKL